MPLPTLADLHTWNTSITALHQVAYLIGRLQASAIEPRPDALHLALLPQSYGLSSVDFPDGGQLQLHFGVGEMRYHAPNGFLSIAKLAEHTQASLFAMFSDLIKLTEVRHADKLQGTDALILDAATAEGYAQAQYAAFTGIARFRARLRGTLSPIVIFPEHFDISTLIFGEGNRDLDESGAHLNIGFAPFTLGQYERPYLYAYAHPYPADYAYPAPPAPAFWNRDGWTGIVTHYDDIARQPDPAQFIETTCMAMVELLLPLVK